MGIITSKPKKPKYRVSVKTGDVQFAGTDADVYLAFYDGHGKRSRDVKLDVIWRNDFERGSTDVFKLGDLGLTGPILQIEVWRGPLPDDWYVEKVEIERMGEGETDVFPVHRWIRKNTRLKLTRWDSLLPQFDPNIEQRRRELEEMKADYELMVPQEGLPPKFCTASAAWVPSSVATAGSLLSLATVDYGGWHPGQSLGVTNMAMTFLNVNDRLRGGNLGQRHVIPSAQQSIVPAKAGIDRFWNVAKRRVNIRMQQKISSLTAGRFKTLDDLRDVYDGVLGTPRGVANWRDDREFGRQRLSGCNPNRIALCTEIPNNFAVTGEMVEPFLEGRTLDDALQARRIFIVNYKVMEDLDLETSDGRQLCCPMCLVLYRDVNNDLYPIVFPHSCAVPCACCTGTLMTICTPLCFPTAVLSHVPALCCPMCLLYRDVNNDLYPLCFPTAVLSHVPALCCPMCLLYRDVNDDLYPIVFPHSCAVPCACCTDVLSHVPAVQLCCPMCLLYRDVNDDLYPIAIQLFQHGDQNPVFLPSDPPYTWLLAKMWFNNADASFHQSTTHIGLTHLMAEPFAVSAKRQLSRSHPLYKLMAPHFIFLIPINFKALATLMAPNAWVDENMGIGRQGTYNLIKKVLKEWRLDVQGTLPADLKDRGVDDPGILPSYYFRDDAILLFNAIHKYIKMVVEAVYDDPSKITEDYELQAWAKEIVTPAEQGGCGMKGVSGNGEFTTTDQIVAVVTAVVYICSAGHAAANFAQYDEYGFPPNYPAYLHGKPPRDKAPRTEQDIIDQLPDKSKTLEMMVITRMLSDRSTNGLGSFEVEYMYDPVGTQAVAEFRKDLDEVHEIIKERNKTRKQPYVYLDPREVPNAISI
ncbi:Arachidonate 5-lipoxygenase [Branchiostoma belcheri]|nr:Arachidonate 5-lipoxygenase [Branchiostoma belcheri]